METLISSQEPSMKPAFRRIIFGLALCAAVLPLSAQATRT